MIFTEVLGDMAMNLETVDLCHWTPLASGGHLLLVPQTNEQLWQLATVGSRLSIDLMKFPKA